MNDEEIQNAVEQMRQEYRQRYMLDVCGLLIADKWCELYGAFLTECSKEILPNDSRKI